MRIFGLDLGTTSIGSAVVDFDREREAGTILRLGVRIFPEARDADGTPLNQTRRTKRMARRQLRRRRERRRTLNLLLTSHGLLPPYGSPEWARAMAADPYALRARGLSEPLSAHELGRALYHLAKRRHFRERDLSDAGEPRKAKPAPAEEAETRSRESFIAALRASGETIGQALAHRDPIAQRKRGEHATRALAREEFDRLIAAQSLRHSALRERAFLGTLDEAIFHQRPVFWRKSTLGRCPLIPEAPLCPKGSWLSQQRRLLEKVNNLTIEGGNARPLDDEERAAILKALATQKKMSWGGVRDVLKPICKARGEDPRTLRFNLEYGDEKGGLAGNVVEVDLAKALGAAWARHPHKESLREFAPRALWECDYDDLGAQRVVIRSEAERTTRRAMLAQVLIHDFGATPAQAAEVVKLHFPQGWEPYSTQALRRFLPELERGERFGALINSPERESWRDVNFPDRDRPTGEILDRLPSPSPRHPEEQRRLANLRNPTVVRVRNELRKVVNNLIELYGKPDLIRLEVTRAIGLSAAEREERSSGMRQRERQRVSASADLIANGIADPSRDLIDKWLLWKECGEVDPYTGDRIGFEPLFWEGQFQVEHIWPRSRSLDDSLANKTLCRIDVNQAKGDRTPFEYFQADPEAWAAAKARIWKMVGARGLRAGKAKRFCAESLPENFASRQINDTGYAARQAREMLQRLWPDVGAQAQVRVQTVTGRLTAQLRGLWGLNDILANSGEKTREDHRHHAVDALAVACAHGGYAQKLSHYLQAEDAFRRGAGAKPSFEADRPWPTIRQDAEAAVQAIVVSHRVRKKVSGPLHKDTVYGDTGREEASRGSVYRYFVRRKPLIALSKGELDEIVDDRVREIVKDWVSARGGDLKKAFSALPQLGDGGPVIRKVRLRVKQQASLMARTANGWVDLGNNHHLAIYRLPNGKVDFQVVSLFEASRRLAKREPVVRREPSGGAKFLMSLSIGDTLRFAKDADGPTTYWRVQKIASKGQISLLDIRDASPKEPTLFEPMVGGIVSRNAVKLSIDPIGRMRPAND